MMDVQMPDSGRAKGFLIFPSYTPAERAVDRAIHCIGVPAGLIAGLVMIWRAMAHGGFVLTATTVIYALGLAGMLGASAAYQLTTAGLAKERLRRLDRAMIFVMIAGTYTPISANVLYGQGGVWLCVILWLLAGLGIFITLVYPRRFERSMMALYLAMGWMLVVLIHQAFNLLRADVLGLILAGGVAYTVGAVIQGIPKLKFHNPVWHALILLAAGLQYTATNLQLF